MTPPDRPRSPLMEGPYGRVLPWLALSARCAVGLCLLNIGLIVVISSSVGASPPAEMVGMLVWAVMQVVPYLAIAVGLGLIFGIFTMLNAVFTCALVLVLPVMMLVGLIAQSATNPGMGFGRGPLAMFGPDFGMGVIMISYPILVLPSLAILVLLSPMEINRFSLDTLMFRRPRPISPSRPAPASPSFGPEPRDFDEKESGASP
jgi:hypothetical protein